MTTRIFQLNALDGLESNHRVPRQALSEFYLAANALQVSLDDEISRIMPLNRLMEIINNKELCLVSPFSFWDDPWESYLFVNDGLYTDSNGIENSVKFDIPLRSAFAQSWTSKKSCDGLWRNYTPIFDNGTKGVAVKVTTTVRDLFKNLYRLEDRFANLRYYIGKVQYVSQKYLEQGLSFPMNCTQNEPVIECLLTKRDDFSYEQEVRLFVVSYDRDIENFGYRFSNIKLEDRKRCKGESFYEDKKEEIYDMLFAEVDPGSFIRSIELDPWTSTRDDDFHRCKQEIVEALEMAVLNPSEISVSKNNLYHRPNVRAKIIS